MKPAAGRNQGATISTAYPDRVAIEFISGADGAKRQSLTYAQLISRITQRAQELARLRVTVGTRAGILGANSVQWLTDFYALQLLGAVVVPLSYKYPPAALSHVIADARLALVLVEDRYQPLLAAGLAAREKNVAVQDSAALSNVVPQSAVPSTSVQVAPLVNTPDITLGDTTALVPAEIFHAQPQPTDLAMVLYTSGSTGNPKGVALSHASHVWVLDTVAEPKASPYTVLVAAPLYHMNALARTQKALAAGETTVLLAEFDAATYAAAIGQFQVLELTGVPPMFALLGTHLDRLPLTARARVRHVNMASAPAGDALFAAMAQTFPQARVTIGYGTTESGPVAFAASENPATPTGSVGRPHPSVHTRLVDPETGSVSSEFGVLQIKTGALFLEYLNQPASNRLVTADGFYHTKDLFRVIAGDYFFAGREDDMFNSGAENVYPAAVEAVLLSHPAVKEAVVVPIADPVKTWKPVAFVTVNAGIDVPTEAELKAFTLDRLEPYAHPRRIEFLVTMPLAATNKVDRKLLQDQGMGIR